MTVFTSLKDMGYQQAKTSDTLIDQAKYAIEAISNFPAEVSAEAKAELYAGYMMRFNENRPAVSYAVIDGHYVRATAEHKKNAKVEKVNIGVEFAFAYTSQEFGKLATTNPALHGIVKKWRSDASDYCSNRMGDLKRAAAKLLNKDKPTTRQTLDFIESMTKFFDAQSKSVKVKETKGDTTAHAVKYRVAVDAFWKAYNA